MQPGYQLVSLRELASVTSSLLALSETLAGRAGYLPLLERGLVGVVLVDLSWCGGVGEAKKVACLAKSYLRPVALHDRTGPVSLVASTHRSINVPNAFIQETVRAHCSSWYGELVTNLPPIVDGRIRPPEGAGLGTELHKGVRRRRDASTRTSSL